jgi:hypothetical protein
MEYPEVWRQNRSLGRGLADDWSEEAERCSATILQAQFASHTSLCSPSLSV